MFYFEITLLKSIWTKIKEILNYLSNHFILKKLDFLRMSQYLENRIILNRAKVLLVLSFSIDSNQATKIPFSKYLVCLGEKWSRCKLELPFTVNHTAHNIHSHYAQYLLSNLGIGTPRLPL